MFPYSERAHAHTQSVTQLKHQQGWSCLYSLDVWQLLRGKKSTVTHLSELKATKSANTQYFVVVASVAGLATIQQHATNYIVCSENRVAVCICSSSQEHSNLSIDINKSVIVAYAPAHVRRCVFLPLSLSILCPMHSRRQCMRRTLKFRYFVINMYLNR